MVFSSVHFLLFFLSVCCLYWSLHPWLVVQNALLAAAGIYFYWTWDWRLLGLLALVYSSTFSLAILVERHRKVGKDKAARACFIASLAVILGVLLTFKYSNFFIMSFCEMFGLDSERLMIRLLVPMGISFYSFMAIGYVMDVYRGKTEASRKPLDFFLFLCFMPLIAAGPIERSDRLLPQFASRRTFSYEDGVDGFMLCCHGLFKK
jgi:D-alanyl-lipoteichoic acid acyltransferase DltB (MBOAT superfamily)